MQFIRSCEQEADRTNRIKCIRNYARYVQKTLHNTSCFHEQEDSCWLKKGLLISVDINGNLREILPVHYSDVIMSTMSSADWRLFTQPIIQAQIKENIKVPSHWLLWVEFTGDRWISRITGQSRGKCFYVMTSSYVDGIFEITAYKTFLYFWNKDNFFPSNRTRNIFLYHT